MIESQEIHAAAGVGATRDFEGPGGPPGGRPVVYEQRSYQLHPGKGKRGKEAERQRGGGGLERQRFREAKLQRFKGSEGSRVQRVKGSERQRFREAKVQRGKGFKGSRVQSCKGINRRVRFFLIV